MTYVATTWVGVNKIGTYVCMYVGDFVVYCQFNFIFTRLIKGASQVCMYVLANLDDVL